MSKLELRAMWCNDVVEEYTKRKLTRVDDRLTAVGGIARVFQHHTEDTYIAGIWLEDLAQSLSWWPHYGLEKYETEIGPTFLGLLPTRRFTTTIHQQSNGPSISVWRITISV